MAARHLRTLAAVIAAGLTFSLAGCSGDTPPPVPEKAVMGPAVLAPDALAGASAVGDCHRLSPKRIDRGVDDRPTVACTERHTTVTFLVETFPEELPGPERVHVRHACERALPEAVGLDTAQLDGTVLTWSWFEPSRAQRVLGARWFRCDVRALPSGPAQAGVALPGSGLPILDRAIPDSLRRCVQTHGTGTAAATYPTCDQPHDFRWVGSVPVTATNYPAAEGWRAKADVGCRPLVGTDAFWFTYPPESEWSQGKRRLSCYRADG